jgi:hypothetical protein
MRGHRACGLALGLALVLGPSAGRGGPFTLKGTQPGLAFPLLAPNDCQGCHGDWDPIRNIEPWPTWAGTMMAQAARDPLFWAALDVANHDVPGIGELCLRCHVPGGWLAGRSEPPGGSADGCGLQGRLDERGNDFEGEECHFCHRMMVNPAPPPGELPSYLENAQFWLDDSDCNGAGEPCRHGPYAYPPGPAPPHAWRQSSYVRSAELCGTCHNVTNPAHNLIDNGIDTGIPFPIERTYREWLLSDFAFAGPAQASCQDCHMPRPSGAPLHACSFQQIDRAGQLATHLFAGGNAWIPDVLAGAYPALGLAAELAAARDAALDMLQSRSATVEVSAPAVARAGEELAVEVKVTNLAGHKLPTGYPEGRRMWLDMTARDATGAILLESGAYDPTTGVLAADPQLKVYEAQLGIWNLSGTGRCDVTDAAGGHLFHFVRNDCVALDNRIPPEGFFGGADLETRPVGYTYPETVPGSGRLVHWDVTTYQVPVPATAVSPVTVTATLRYQTASKDYVDFLRDQAVIHGFPDDCLARTSGPPGRSRGELLHDLWAATDRSPPVDMGLATATATVRLVDPFLCYHARRTRGTTGPVLPSSLGYTTTFETGAVSVRGTRALCAPAAVGGTDVLDAATHLEWHRTRPAAGPLRHLPRQGLAVRDEFGTLTLNTSRLAGLLMPVGVDPTTFQPRPAGSEVDPFLCYKAKLGSGTPGFTPVAVAVADGSTPARALEVVAPRALCLPAALGAAAVAHPAARLVCYRVRPARGVERSASLPDLKVSGAFGQGHVDRLAEDTLCVPATS